MFDVVTNINKNLILSQNCVHFFKIYMIKNHIFFRLKLLSTILLQILQNKILCL